MNKKVIDIATRNAMNLAVKMPGSFHDGFLAGIHWRDHNPAPESNVQGLVSALEQIVNCWDFTNESKIVPKTWGSDLGPDYGLAAGALLRCRQALTQWKEIK